MERLGEMQPTHGLANGDPCQITRALWFSPKFPSELDRILQNLVSSFIHAQQSPFPCLRGEIWLLWHLTYSKILECKFLILHLRFVEQPRRPEHVQKANQHSTLSPATIESCAVTSHGLSGQDQRQRGMACGVDVHQPIPDEFHQDVCAD